MYRRQFREGLLETESVFIRPNPVEKLEAIGISVKEIENMDDREIIVAFERAGLDPYLYEI
ncbi:MAG: hypothetical protein Q4B31_05080 [Clostridia bacterium]|nr:hypothetical protein [Clostridia bacterium]